MSLIGRAAARVARTAAGRPFVRAASTSTSSSGIEPVIPAAAPYSEVDGEFPTYDASKGWRMDGVVQVPGTELESNKPTVWGTLKGSARLLGMGVFALVSAYYVERYYEKWNRKQTAVATANPRRPIVLA